MSEKASTRDTVLWNAAHSLEIAHARVEGAALEAQRAQDNLVEAQRQLADQLAFKVEMEAAGFKYPGVAPITLLRKSVEDRPIAPEAQANGGVDKP